MQISQQKTKGLVLVSTLAALAYVLMFISFPIIPAFSFLKLDFSDVPILIGLFVVGPLGASEIVILKLFLFWMTHGFSVLELIGLIPSLIVSLIFIGIFYLYRESITKPGFKKFVPAIIIGVVMAIVLSILNYFIFLPMYMKVFGFDMGLPLFKIILYGVAPFNLIKGIVESLVFIIIYRRLSKLIR